MTNDERARALAGSRPCNYGGNGDDRAEMDWLARIAELVAAFADVERDTVMKCVAMAEAVRDENQRLADENVPSYSTYSQRSNGADFAADAIRALLAPAKDGGT